MEDINKCKCQDLMYELIEPCMERGLVAALTHNALKDVKDKRSDMALDVSNIRHRVNLLHDAIVEQYKPEMHLDDDSGLLHIDMLMGELVELRKKILEKCTVDELYKKNMSNKTYLPEVEPTQLAPVENITVPPTRTLPPTRIDLNEIVYSNQ